MKFATVSFKKNATKHALIIVTVSGGATTAFVCGNSSGFRFRGACFHTLAEEQLDE
jgi:hypothetical protein